MQTEPNTGTESTVASSPYAREVRPDEYFYGVKASMPGEVVTGYLPEHDNDKRCEPLAHETDLVLVRRDDDPGNFRVQIVVGERLSVVVDMEQFAEAFLAVVPRWFWSPKDTRP